MELLSDQYDMTAYWTWFLVWARMSGLLSVLPGIGTEQIPTTIRGAIGMIFAILITVTGVRAPIPETLAEGGLMLIMEYFAGYVIALIPAYIVGSLALAGQVVSASIGLSMANMIDPSIGQSVSVLSRVQVLVGTVLFLAIDGHHIVIKAAAGIGDFMPVGGFRPDASVALILINQFERLFESAVIMTAPILVTVLVTQFVLGIVTKFVSQINIFIISLPLSIGIGLFMTVFTFPGIIDNLMDEYREVEEIVHTLLQE